MGDIEHKKRAGNTHQRSCPVERLKTLLKPVDNLFDLCGCRRGACVCEELALAKAKKTAARDFLYRWIDGYGAD